MPKYQSTAYASQAIFFAKKGKVLIRMDDKNGWQKNGAKIAPKDQKKTMFSPGLVK
jgi:hypothetical protein